MTVGNKILELRRAKRLSRQEVAKKCNFSLYSLWRWETGRQSPRVDELEQLARVLQVSVDALLTKS